MSKVANQIGNGPHGTRNMDSTEAPGAYQGSDTETQSSATTDRGSAAGRLAAAAHSAIDSFEARAADAEDMLREKGSALSAKGEDASEQARELATQAKGNTLQFIEEKPVQSLAIAFGVGALVATLLRK